MCVWHIYSLLSGRGIRSCTCYFVSRTMGISTFTLGLLLYRSVTSHQGHSKSFTTSFSVGLCFHTPAAPTPASICRCHSINSTYVLSCHSTFLIAQVFFSRMYSYLSSELDGIPICTPLPKIPATELLLNFSCCSELLGLCFQLYNCSKSPICNLMLFQTLDVENRSYRWL